MSVPAHVTMLDFIATPGYKQPFFGCHEDPVTCVATYCCSCIVVGVAVGRLNKTEFDLVACLCSGIGAYRLRRAVQSMFGIKESEDASTCAVSLCGYCSVCQDVSELQWRGAIAPLLVQKTQTSQPERVPQMTTETTPALAPVTVVHEAPVTVVSQEVEKVVLPQV